MSIFGPPNVTKLEARKNVKGLLKSLSYVKDPRIRRAAATAPGKMRYARAVEPLIARLNDSFEDVRQSTAEALGKIGDAQAVEPLLVALKDQDASVRQTIAKVLGKIRDARAVQSLITKLKDSSVHVLEAAAKALIRIGEPAVEPLVTALEDPDHEVRENAARLLHHLGRVPDKGHSAARYWIAKKEWDTCTRLGEVAVTPLIATLKDQETSLRQAAADALDRFPHALRRYGRKRAWTGQP